MEHDGKNLTVTEVGRSVQLLKIDGYSATSTMVGSAKFIKPRSRWNIDGHEWEVHFYPDHSASSLRTRTSFPHSTSRMGRSEAHPCQ